jgi:hypothetical protein
MLQREPRGGPVLATHTFHVQITVTLPESRAWLQRATQPSDSIRHWLKACLNLNSVGAEHFSYRDHMSPREQREIDVQTWGRMRR